ncbi:hypothetical protein NL676_005082 [Syzygium grande]|nr:hypothetical protein NL676_005082 [Syzygium grande]
MRVTRSPISGKRACLGGDVEAEQVLGESRDADGHGRDAVRAEGVGVAEDGRLPAMGVQRPRSPKGRRLLPRRRQGGGAPREIRGGGGGARGPRDRRSGGGGRGFRRGGSARAAGRRRGPPPRGHAHDVHILSCGFLLIFSAYGAAQNLESTVNTADNLGTISLGILHVSFTSFSSVASLALANLKPSWYTMVPACLYLGFAASIIWVGQGTYLTSTARIHAKDRSLHEGTIIGAFNGEFWGMFAIHQVVGNLVSLAVLREETDGSASGTKLLFIVFLCSMTFGTILMCFLRKRDSREERASPEYPASFHSSLVSLSKSVITPLFDVRMLLIILLIAYSGLQQAFVWYFTFFSGLVGLLSIALYVNK